MDHDKAILLFVVSSLLLFTVAALAHAVIRRGWLKGPEAKARPDYADLLAYANDQCVLETFRLAKHFILVTLIWLTPADANPLAERRNIGIVAVAILLGVTSVWSLFRRQVRFQRFKERQ